MASESAAPPPPPGGTASRRLILDTDVGVDDAVAIMVLLRYVETHTDLDLLAITTVAGNVEVAQATQNARLILDQFEAWDVPLYQGAAVPIVGKRQDAGEWHGKDGLGEMDRSALPVKTPRPGSVAAAARDTERLPAATAPPDAKANGADPNEHAVNAIIRILGDAAATRRHVDLLCIGPMTNVALALRMRPDVIAGVGTFYFMGGTDSAKGNCTATAEFNVYGDPEAAQMCLQSFSAVTMISWEATLNHAVPWDFVDEWRAPPTQRAKFLTAFTQFLIDKTKADLPDFAFLMPDPLAMAVVLDPTMVTKHVKRPTTIELAGTHSRGLVVIDWRSGVSDVSAEELARVGEEWSACTIVQDVDQDKFHAMLLESVQGGAEA